MRQTFGTTLLLLAVAIGVSSGADNSLGTWRINVEKSRAATKALTETERAAARALSGTSATLKNGTVTREAADGGVKLTNHAEMSDGTTRHSTFVAKYDGKEVAITGNNQFDRIAVKQVDANTFTDERRKSNGSATAIGQTAISDGGKTMTVTLKITAQGTAYTVVYVFDKQ
jgi:hypothetical protein